MNTTPVFPVEACPNRATRRFTLSRRRQRKGQALILAVLVMLMVAVLSAGFLVVVSGNLNQTARVTDKTRAIESARSGLKFVNDQLTYSSPGEKWRPGFIPADYNSLTKPEQDLLGAGESSIPTQSNNGAATYGIYYSSVDIANGWAGRFAKFPDPLAPRSDAPQYLARVERVVNQTTDPQYGLPAGDADLADPAKAGMLRITVIGLSNDDPAAFSKVVAYKGGPNSVFNVMRTVGNYDFKNKTVPSATADYDNTAQTLSLSNVKGAFPAEPFVVMVGNAGATDLQAGVVDSHTGSEATNDLKLHLATDPFAKGLAGVHVELAAQLGASLPVGISGTESAIDFNNNGTIDSGENASLLVSSGGTAGGARVNGGLALTGAVSLPALDATAGQTVRASGLMVQQAPTTASKATVTTSTAPTPPLDLANGSNATGFPGSGISTDLVNDGADRMQGNATGNRTVDPFTPPDISSGAAAGRYRQLTRDSTPVIAATAGQPSPSEFGYGQGIYINNPTDRERTTVGGTLRDMNQKELVQMWLSRTNDTAGKIIEDTTDFCRKGTPAAVTANVSLEQQHLRGWVGPDEFHARGALVELFNDAADGNKPKIAITLDSRSDNTPVVGTTPAVTTNASGPVPAKAWKDANGATQPGVYRKVLDWPKNGVIFAEGNVRVRGTIDTTKVDAPNSLTVVSQNNVYVDGSLGAGTKKVLLLARKNVVANPTQAIFRPDVQTLFTQAATFTAVGTAVNVSVSDTTDFKVGDVVETSTTAAPATIKTVAVVQGITNTTTLSLSPIQTGTIDSGDVMRTRLDTMPPALNGRSVIASPADTIQRRLQISDVANLDSVFRLTFDHSAEEVKALAIGTTGTTPTTSIFWSNKRKATTDPNANITSGEKFAQGDSSSTPSPDKFPATLPSTEGNAQLNTISAISTAIANSTPHTDANDNAINWKYTAVPVASYNNAPFHYLAGLGNRADFGVTLPPPGTSPERRADINATTNTNTGRSGPTHNMLLATSITPLWEGKPVALGGFDTSTAIPTPVPASTSFGFSPNYLPVGAPPA